MPSLQVRHRLILSFALVALLVGVLAYLALALGGRTSRSLAELDTTELQASHALAAAAQGSQAALQELTAGRLRTDTEAERPASALASQLALFARHLAEARQAAPSPLLAQIEQAFGTYRSRAEEASRLLEADPEAAASYLAAEVEPLFFSTLFPLVTQQQAEAQAALAAQIEGARGTASRARWLLVALAVLVALAAAGLGLLMVQFLGRRLASLAPTLNAIEAGRLDRRVKVLERDELGEVGRVLNHVVEELAATTVYKSYVENIVRSIADPVVVVDPEVRIALVNQATLEVLGLSREELLGKSVTAIFAHSGRHRGAAIKRTIEQGLAGNVETSFRAKDGREIPVSLSSALVRQGPEVQGLVIVAKDITQRKQFEAELIEAKNRAEQMVHLRDAFLANMSHEIRTPLTGILGSAQVLSEVVEGEHRNLARIIEDAGTRLLDTINSVLEMARIEAGEVQPDLEVMDLAEEAEAAARVLKMMADKKGLALRVQPPEEAVFAQIDRSCLHRILNNLIGNAIKFTREGSVSVEVEAAQEEAILTVRDTGVGIAREFLPHLFDDFKQESTGLKRSHEGSGLGLAITKKLVEIMGGEISVESIKGIGSSFTVRFPRVPTPERPAEAERPEASRGPVFETLPARERYPWETEEAALAEEPTFRPPPPPEEREPKDILLIEDNAQNAYMAQFMLRSYSSDIATTPEEALELVRHHQYGVLLVDINLGADRSGIDLLKELRQIPGYGRTPAVAVTAYALPGDEDRFLEAGFDNYVAKPFRKEKLIEAVERALSTPPEPEGPSLDAILSGSFDDFETLPGVDPAKAPAGPEAHASPSDDEGPDAENLGVEALSAGSFDGDGFGADGFDGDGSFDEMAFASDAFPPADDPHDPSDDHPGGPHPAAGG